MTSPTTSPVTGYLKERHRFHVPAEILSGSPRQVLPEPDHPRRRVTTQIEFNCVSHRCISSTILHGKPGAAFKGSSST
jgi:hypothetical protein